jgi:predicted kinase
MVVKPTLYLMLGYPGSGKTTTAKVIHELTGATHLWADQIRRERFGEPTYSHEENLKLYSHLNQEAAELLAAGNSIVYDTNFNFYKDRQLMRELAKNHGVKALLVWVTTPKEIAKERAIDGTKHRHTRVLGDMPPDQFERMSRNLQPPREDEPYVKIDGTKVTKGYIKKQLGL